MTEKVFENPCEGYDVEMNVILNGSPWWGYSFKVKEDSFPSTIFPTISSLCEEKPSNQEIFSKKKTKKRTLHFSKDELGPEFKFRLEGKESRLIYELKISFYPKSKGIRYFVIQTKTQGVTLYDFFEILEKEVRIWEKYG